MKGYKAWRFLLESVFDIIGQKVLIGIPGIKNEYTGRSEELLSDWLATNNKYAWIRIPACCEYRIVEL